MFAKNNFVLKKPLLLIAFTSCVFLTSFYVLSYPTNNVTITADDFGMNKDPSDPSHLPSDKLQQMFNQVQSGQFSQLEPLQITPEHFLNDSSSSKAWKNKNIVFDDPRLAITLTLNHLKNQISSNTKHSLPFHWVDWIDMSSLNSQLSQPVEKRFSCNDIKSKLEYVVPTDEPNAYNDNAFIQCIDNQDITPRQLAELGFANHDQVPGFIYFDYCIFKTDESIRLLQGKTYLMTHAPNPYKIMFLNDQGTDLVFDVTSKEKIINSGLMNQYVANNDISPKSTLTLDPVAEINSLVETSKKVSKESTTGSDQSVSVASPSTSASKRDDSDPYSNFSAFKYLTPSMFHYSKANIVEQMALYKRLAGKRALTLQEESFLYSLEKSKGVNTHTEDTYFQMSSMQLTDSNTDNGWHYDWRFFNGKLVDDQKTSIILERLMRNWFKFATKHDMISWIMHGPLLSFYWTGKMFPYDNDLDIQMPVEHLVKLGELYNQTLVVEDLNEGYGKFLIDVGTFVHNRDISKKSNHIDARFIDVDTGIYIDITGLAVSKERTPRNYFKNINGDEEEGTLMSKENPVEVYNDRRLHFYTFDQLSPLKMSMLSGVPTYIPNEFIRRLKFEYPDGGIVNEEHNKWYFVPEVNNWVHQDNLMAIVDDVNDYRKSEEDGSSRVDIEKLLEFARKMSQHDLIKLLKIDHSLLLDYSRSQDLNAFHKREMEYLVKIDPKKKPGKNDPKGAEGKVIDNPDIYRDESYDKFIRENVKLSSPIRMSLFEYDYQKKHQ